MKKKILIVDDDWGIVQIIQSLLDLSGYKTVVAADGREAVQVARDEDPDLILLDIMMPEMDGFDVCKFLRRDHDFDDTRIIMLTSLTQMGDAEKSFSAGANDFLGKPFDADRLLLKVKKQLEEV